MTSRSTGIDYQQSSDMCDKYWNIPDYPAREKFILAHISSFGDMHDLVVRCTYSDTNCDIVNYSFFDHKDYVYVQCSFSVDRTASSFQYMFISLENDFFKKYIVNLERKNHISCVLGMIDDSMSLLPYRDKFLEYEEHSGAIKKLKKELYDDFISRYSFDKVKDEISVELVARNLLSACKKYYKTQ